MNPIDEAKYLLQNDRVEECISLLINEIRKILLKERKLAEQKGEKITNNSDLTNLAANTDKSLVVLSAALKRLQYFFSNRMIDYDQYTQERSRIIFGILENLDFLQREEHLFGMNKTETILFFEGSVLNQSLLIQQLEELAKNLKLSS